MNNEIKIDLISQHQGENLAQIDLINEKIKTEVNVDLIGKYNGMINNLFAKNVALETLKESLV